MNTKAPSLAELQALFQHAVMTGDSAGFLAHVPDSARTTRDVLFGVYQYAYMARLVDIIADDHGLLRSYLGDEMFETMARNFLAAHPSHTPNARWVGEGLPRFLAEQDPFRQHPELSELAAIERALLSAFDAPDAPVLGLEALRAVPPDSWSDLVFAPHPATRALHLRTNALAIWLALKDETAPPEAQRLEPPETAFVWRGESGGAIRPVAAEEAMMWHEASKGVPFGRLCELIAVFGDPDTAAGRAAGYLQRWLADSLLTAATLTGVPNFQRRVRATAS